MLCLELLLVSMAPAVLHFPEHRQAPLGHSHAYILLVHTFYLIVVLLAVVYVSAALV